MVQQNVKVINPSGLHLRPAAVLAKLAASRKSAITIIYKEKKINCKSSLNIMAAGIMKGTEVLIQCQGNEEEQDLTTIVTAIESGLGEL